MRGFTLILLTLLGSAARGETLISEAKIREITARGFVLSVGTESMTVEDASSTKFWLSKASAKREAFKADQSVMVRIKTDANVPALREMADLTSWTWLERVRSQFIGGSLVKHDGKTLSVKFDDGSTFAYRATDKSKIRLTDGESKFSTLKEGQRIYVKGRLLSNLDTWLAEIVDRAPAQAPAKTSRSKTASKAPPLPKTGTFECTALGYNLGLQMLDVLHGIETIHITINRDTRWYVNDRKVATPESVVKGAGLKIAFKRDRYGRIVATRIDTRV